MEAAGGKKERAEQMIEFSVRLSASKFSYGSASNI
jgi:hypothetical protein